MAVGFRGGVLTGLALSFGAALLEPLWRPALARYGRTLAKGALKQGLAAYEIGRGQLAELGETVEDLVAEAQIERAIERAGHGDATPAPSASNEPAGPA
jgi:hypothetical protein